MPLILTAPYKIFPQDGIIGDKIGDWTVAWRAKSDKYNQTSFNYDISLDEVQKATRVAIAYYDSTMEEIVVSDMYSFDMPNTWKIRHPFNIKRENFNVNAMQESTGTVFPSRVLMCGRDSFFARNTLTLEWASGEFGVIGIVGTSAPFYSGFCHTLGDFASLSNRKYDTTLSSPQRRFIILVK